MVFTNEILCGFKIAWPDFKHRFFPRQRRTSSCRFAGSGMVHNRSGNVRMNPLLLRSQAPRIGNPGSVPPSPGRGHQAVSLLPKQHLPEQKPMR
jgi:hypothetical protein